MIKFLASLIIAFILSSTTLAQAPDTTNENRELWYFYFGFGYSKMFYPGDLQETVDELSELEDVSRLPLTWDVYGIYFHIARETILGTFFTAAGDRYDRGERGGIQINQYTVGVSVIHYMDQRFGKGFFLRSDIGAAHLGASDLDMKEDGISILAGGGWSLDLGGTRILFNSNYTYRLFNSGAYHTLTLSLGGLF